jgi:glycosyltransferase involved in cell wall biosynthesis
MKLAVVTNILTPYRIPLLEALRERVGELDVLLMAEREENRAWRLAPTTLACQVLPGWHPRPRGAETSLHINYGVLRALHAIRPDVVLSGGFAPANLAAWLYCTLTRRPFVGWGELTSADVTSKSRPARAVRRLLSRWSRGAIASSSEAAAVFAHYGVARERLLTAPMPVDVDFFHARAGACRQSRWWREQRARFPGPILLSLGRLAQRKGYRELFAIYERVLAQRADVSLLIVGDGPERATLEREVATRGWRAVHFLGFRQAEEVARFLALADVFIFHTLSDPFGAVLSEAMAAGVPAAASVHAAATADLIEQGVTGLRIEPRDSAAAAHAVLHLLALGPAPRAALIAAAYARVKQHDIAASSALMADFLGALARSGKPHARGVQSHARG